MKHVIKTEKPFTFKKRHKRTGPLYSTAEERIKRLKKKSKRGGVNFLLYIGAGPIRLPVYWHLKIWNSRFTDPLRWSVHSTPKFVLFRHCAEDMLSIPASNSKFTLYLSPVLRLRSRPRRLCSSVTEISNFYTL